PLLTGIPGEGLQARARLGSTSRSASTSQRPRSTASLGRRSYRLGEPPDALVDLGGCQGAEQQRMLLAEAYEREGVPPFPACARWPTSRRQRPALRSHDESRIARLNAEKRHVGAVYVNEASLAEAGVPAKARIEPLDGENAARPTAARLGKRLLERAGDDDGVVRLEPETLRPELKGDGWPTVAVRADGDEIWPSIWIEVAHEHTAICAGEERQEWRGEGGRREGHANESAAERRVQGEIGREPCQLDSGTAEAGKERPIAGAEGDGRYDRRYTRAACQCAEERSVGREPIDGECTIRDDHRAVTKHCRVGHTHAARRRERPDAELAESGIQRTVRAVSRNEDMLPVDRRRGHDHLAVGLEGYRRFRRRSVHDSAHAVCAIRPIEASLPGVPAHDEIPGHVANRQEEAAVPLQR